MSVYVELKYQPVEYGDLSKCVLYVDLNRIVGEIHGGHIHSREWYYDVEVDEVHGVAVEAKRTQR